MKMNLKNFDVRFELNIPKKDKLSDVIQSLFTGDDEITLLYFSGYGII